jgi:hypothetical protein
MPHAAPLDAGERSIGRVLRVGAWSSGGLFLASVMLQAIPQAAQWQPEIQVLRAAAASLLVVAPVVRLIVAGSVLGIHGEWRYAAAAGGVLGLLGLALGLGYTH